MLHMPMGANMNKKHNSFRLILAVFLISALFGCSKSIGLIQKEIQIYEGQEIDPKVYLSDEFKNNKEVKITNNANSKVPGEYEIVFKLNNSETKLKVTVLSDPVSLIKQKITLETGSAFNPKDYISNEDIPNDIKIVNNVDVKKPGEYIVVYSFSGIEKIMNVSVKNPEFILTQNSISIDLGSAFDPMNYLTVADRTNANIIVNNKVDSKTPGTYLVTYQLNNVSKTLSVTVVNITLPTPAPTPPTSYTLEILSLTSPIAAGAIATIVVQGKTGEQYSIIVNYKSGPSTAAGLETKLADASGRISWTWKVGAKTTPGNWGIVISGDGKVANTLITVN